MNWQRQCGAGGAAPPTPRWPVGAASLAMDIHSQIATFLPPPRRRCRCDGRYPPRDRICTPRRSRSPHRRDEVTRRRRRRRRARRHVVRRSSRSFAPRQSTKLYLIWFTHSHRDRDRYAHTRTQSVTINSLSSTRPTDRLLLSCFFGRMIEPVLGTGRTRTRPRPLKGAIPW